jgi:hypothetical protein
VVLQGHQVALELSRANFSRSPSLRRGLSTKDSGIHCIAMYSTRELHGAGTRIESRSHHPEYYVPRITRLVAGLLFGAFRGGGQVTTAQAANGPYSKMVFR